MALSETVVIGGRFVAISGLPFGHYLCADKTSS